MNEATKWIGGLDRIHRARGILTCFDLTATPFAPTGKKSGEETLFGLDRQRLWIERRHRIGLGEDAARGGARRRQTRRKVQVALLSHLQRPEVKTDVNRKAEPQTPLAGSGDQWLLLPGQGLAGNREGVEEEQSSPPRQ